MAGSTRVERPFVGRPEAVDALRRRSDGVRAGRGGLTVIEGEAGVGKSTLVEGLVRDARAKGLRVLVARARSLDNPPPYQLLNEALASAERIDPDDAPTGASASVSTLAFAPTAVGPEMAFDLPALIGPESWLLEEPLVGGISAPMGPGTERRHRLDQSLVNELLSWGDRAPTAVVLEDVHLSDEASLEALAAMAPQLTTHALWVVFTRLPLTTLGGARRARLEGIERAAESDLVVLRPLTPSEAGEFVRHVGGAGDVGPDEIIQWHSQSRGNPLFLEQLIRRRGRLTARPEKASDQSASEFTEYLVRQLPDLPPEEERVLAVASVLGREFPFGLLMRASDDDEETLAEVVQELVGRGILRETPDEGLEFPRDDLRTQVYARLTEARRRLLHRRAAEALEAYATADVATVYALARHCFLGKIDDKAVAYNRLAAEFAARSFAPLVAREHLERAREALSRVQPRDPVAELETALELAVQLDLLGELDLAERLLKATLSDVETRPEIPPALRAFAAVCLARIYSDQGRWEEVDRITTALTGPQALPIGPRTQLAVHRLRGEFLYFHGRYRESLDEHDRAIAIARAQHEDREVALETVRRANVLGMIPGRFEEAVADYRRIIAALLERGDKSEAAYAQIYLGVVLSQHGRNDEGLDALRSAKELAEAAHDPRRLGWALFNIADLERANHHLEIARESNGEARDLLERIGDRYGLVQTYIIEGKIRLQADELDAAHLALLEGYRLVRELNVPADEVEVLLRLAELALARSDQPQAESRLSELARMGLERLRPDLAEDYRRFKERVLVGGGGDPAA